MAQLRVVVGRDPELLLRTAASGFLTPRAATTEAPFPTVPYLLALRQGGLRDDVIAMAAESGVKGWFDPPLCIFHELPRWIGAPQRETLGEYERLVLITRLVREHGIELFAKASKCDHFVGHIDRLFGELISEDVSGARFAEALDTRTARDAFETRRDNDLARVYVAYLAELARLEKADGRDQWIHCARAIRDGTAKLTEALHGRREIRIVGLQDLKRGWLHLIRALAESSSIDTVTLYSSVDLPLEGLDAEWERQRDRGDSPVAALFAEERPAERIGKATVVKAPDIDREMDQIAIEIRALVEAGTAPHRIAVVTRDARPNLDRALASLARLGVPATARQRVMLTSIPVVRAIASLFAAAADGWTRGGLVELAYQPYFAGGLDAEVLNAIGYRRLVLGLDDWEAALIDLEKRAMRVEGEDAAERHGRPLPAPARVAAVRDAFRVFAAEARALDRERTVLEWLEWLLAFLESDPWKVLEAVRTIPGDRIDVVRLDLAGWTSLTTIVHEWHRAVVEHGAEPRSLVAAEFNAQLREFLTGDVPILTPMSRGVQVLEALAAAYRSFDYVFLTGMEAGAFPKSAPVSPLFDDADRNALVKAGLPLELDAVWDERERDLFRIIVAGARRGFTMSYARLDAAGREVIASAFVDELTEVATVEQRTMSASLVVLPGVSLYRALDGPELALHAATIEYERIDKVPSRYNGRIEAPDLVGWLAQEFGDDRLWSATQLEDFAKCPWAYFSKRLLRIEKLNDPDGDVDPATRGQLLHDALKMFYDSAKERVGGAVFLTGADSGWAKELATKCVSQIVDDYASRERLGHPSLLEAKRSEYVRMLRGYLTWEIKLHDDMVNPPPRARKAPAMIRTGVVSHEEKFEDELLERAGVRIRYRGSIDRVEVSVDDRIAEGEYVVAADYKTTVSSTPGQGNATAWKDGVVLQVPLYALALSRMRPDAQIARAGYLALSTPKEVLQLDLIAIDKKTHELVPKPDADDMWSAALDSAIEHVKSARRGEFAAGPPGKCTCPPWCHGRDICRIPGGPVTR
ncbi:MAG: PD-(D/E)XK nuclease family protein [Gemmatimonadaceae bacterium]|nr:PD-(D/E)XK nuclease family protein [Gemmatimonadaceae bacterium]